MKWIKLSEKRPRNKSQILITNGKDINHYVVYKEGEDEHNPCSDLTGRPFYGNHEWGNTTHWMYVEDIPLPCESQCKSKCLRCKN